MYTMNVNDKRESRKRSRDRSMNPDLKQPVDKRSRTEYDPRQYRKPSGRLSDSQIQSDLRQMKRRKETPRKACPMNTIGDDCFGFLLGFLPVRDISCFRAVSHDFRDICDSVLLRIDKISTKDIPDDLFVDVTCRNCYNIRELTLYRSLSFKEIQILVQKCQRIESFYLRGDGKIWCAHDNQKPTGIQCTDFVVSYLGEHLPNLKLLALGGCVNPADLVKFTELCTTLKEFQCILTDLCGKKDVLVSALDELIRRQMNLETLTLYIGCTAKHFSKSQSWKRVKRMHFMGIPGEFDVNDTFWQTPQMETFKFTSCSKEKYERFVFHAVDNFKMTMRNSHNLERW